MFAWEKKDPCGAIEWATNDSAMVPLISCKADMSFWFKAKYPGCGTSEIRGRPGERTYFILYLFYLYTVKSSVKNKIIKTTLFYKIAVWEPD